MGWFLQEAKRWAEFIETYGDPSEITAEEAKLIDPNRLWTLWDASDDYLTNGFSEDDKAIGYFAAPRAWPVGTKDLIFTMTIWVDCPTCEQMEEAAETWDQDDCPECKGRGALWIDLDDCLHAETDEEVFDKRRES